LGKVVLFEEHINLGYDVLSRIFYDAEDGYFALGEAIMTYEYNKNDN